LENPRLHEIFRREIAAVEKLAQTDISVMSALLKARNEAAAEHNYAVSLKLCGKSQIAILHEKLCKLGLIDLCRKKGLLP
jgi:hypothetical protein